MILANQVGARVPAMLERDLDPTGWQPFDVETVKADAKESVAGEVVEPAIEEKPPLPQQFKGPKRSKDKPAGVQSNPHFNET